MDASAAAAVDRHAEQEAEDMVALTSAETGIANTIFVSPKGFARHAPRLKVAIDPPDTFDTTSKTASMALHDHAVSGERIRTPGWCAVEHQGPGRFSGGVIITPPKKPMPAMKSWPRPLPAVQTMAELLRRLKSL
jgi:hypothetical protein